MRLEELHAAARGGVLLHHVVHGLAGVDNGAVVAATERVADLLKGVLGERAGDIHRDLAGNGDVVGPALAGHVAVADLEVIGHALLDRLDGKDGLRLLHEHVVQEAFGGREVDGLAGEGGVAGDLDQRAFEAADVLGDVLRDEIDDGRGQVAFERGGLRAEDGDARFDVG